MRDTHKYSIEDSPEDIWLDPQCEYGSQVGRTYGLFDEGACENCCSPCVKYIRSDIADNIIADLARALSIFAAYSVSSIGMDLDGYVIKLASENTQQPAFADFDHARALLARIPKPEDRESSRSAR